MSNHSVLAENGLSHYISDIVAELCKQLDISWIDHLRLLWSNAVPPDECRLGPGLRHHGLFLPLDMKGELSVQEWKILIASSLLYIKAQRQFFRRKGWLKLLVPLLIATIGFPIIQFVLATAGFILTAAMMVLYGVAVLLVIMRVYQGENRSVRFMADDDTAKLVGKDALVHVMRKVEQVLARNAEKKTLWKRRAGSLFGGPNIVDRIERLVGN